jgi:bifunctional non-homologous end joining protein LigD
VALSIAGLHPTLATSGPLPNGPDWSFEPKWDGFRGMPVVDSAVRVLSRRGNDLTYLCPSVEQLHAHAFGPAVFDGEIVAFRDGVQSFEGLQSAMRRRSSEAIVFLVFDVLCLSGASLVDRAYAERREVLEAIDLPEGISLTPRFDDGAALFSATRSNGYEGVVAKKLRSRYRPGLRTRDWIKTKHWQEAEFVIGGWAPPRPDHGWGLLIGDMGEDGRLHYCGRVEFGITSPLRDELENRLQPRQSCPFVEIVHEPGAQFVKPNVTAEIRFLERTSGDRLRHATFRQLGGRWKSASPAVRESERDNDPT